MFVFGLHDLLSVFICTISNGFLTWDRKALVQFVDHANENTQMQTVDPETLCCLGFTFKYTRVEHVFWERTCFHLWTKRNIAWTKLPPPVLLPKYASSNTKGAFPTIESVPIERIGEITRLELTCSRVQLRARVQALSCKARAGSKDDSS